MKRIIITGGPSVGKTTMLDELAKLGAVTVPEAARMIIAEEQQRDSDILPWMNVYEFQKKVLERQIELENSFDGKMFVCDRGILDGVGYCMHDNICLPSKYRGLENNRYQQVFILDRLPTFENDGQRREDLQTAIEIHQSIGKGYKEYGYNPIRIPALDIEQRVEYMTQLL